jgi:hypothetical protein
MVNAKMNNRDQETGPNQPTAEERQLLDKALADYQRDRCPGTPWRDVLTQIRSSESS